uniref:Uncharacterized protein n=1 Tax=Arundo donax TaxID=35708 RepID=A0A0A9AVM3_ARUDO
MVSPVTYKGKTRLVGTIEQPYEILSLYI